MAARTWRKADSKIADAIMAEELFGPIAPIIEANYKEAYAMINRYLPHRTPNSPKS